MAIRSELGVASLDGVFISLFQVGLPLLLPLILTKALNSNLLLKRPLATQCATSAVLFGTGDVIAQQVIERKRSRHDVSRLSFSRWLVDNVYLWEFLSLPERRVSRFSEVATSTVHLWPCTLITNPTLCKHQAACSGRPFRNGLRFSAVCALPHQPRLSSTVCVRASLPSNTSLILSVLQTWLDQTLMAPCSSIYLGLCVSYP